MAHSLPLGPLSRLPQLPLSEEPETRFVAPAAAGRKQAPAVTKQQQEARKRAEEGAQVMEAAGQVSLYSFNINELYDYDLPNIRRPSDALTAMASQKLNSGSRKGSSRVLPPLDAPEGGAGDAADEQRDPAAEEEEGEEEGEGKLKTGDEAANFFARNGNHTPVKFVYLNRARTGDAFRPYDLSVVSREQVDAEYFTMSACGVVHVFASGLPSEFVLLSTWMQQSTFFNVLRAPAPPRPVAPPSPFTPSLTSGISHPLTPPPPLLPQRRTPEHPWGATCCLNPAPLHLSAPACTSLHRSAPLCTSLHLCSPDLTRHRHRHRHCHHYPSVAHQLLSVARVKDCDRSAAALCGAEEAEARGDRHVVEDERLRLCLLGRQDAHLRFVAAPRHRLPASKREIPHHAGPRALTQGRRATALLGAWAA